jgi:hypothetical protein
MIDDLIIAAGICSMLALPLAVASIASLVRSFRHARADLRAARRRIADLEALIDEK